MEPNTKEQTTCVEERTAKLIYLASPYTHDEMQVVAYRYNKTVAFVAANLSQHEFIYSPIVYAHNIATAHKLPTNAEWWWSFNKTMIERCDVMWLLGLAGWDESKGVRQEVDFGHIIGKIILYKPPL